MMCGWTPTRQCPPAADIPCPAGGDYFCGRYDWLQAKPVAAEDVDAQDAPEWPEGPSDGQLADHVQQLADRMGEWLSASVFVNTPLYPEHGDKCSAELEEWCRAARDLLWAYAGMLRAGDPE